MSNYVLSAIWCRTNLTTRELDVSNDSCLFTQFEWHSRYINKLQNGNTFEVGKPGQCPNELESLYQSLTSCGIFKELIRHFREDTTDSTSLTFDDRLSMGYVFIQTNIQRIHRYNSSRILQWYTICHDNALRGCKLYPRCIFIYQWSRIFSRNGFKPKIWTPRQANTQNHCSNKAARVIQTFKNLTLTLTTSS